MVSMAVLGMIGWMSPSNVYQLAVENDFIKSLKSKLTEYNKAMPEDRVYVHFDKPFYKPGETIWLGAYVRNGADLKPSQKSDIVHVELIGPKGNVERTINLVAKNGKAAGDFALDKYAVGGMYKVRAYTNWMKNDRADNCFEKELQVQDIVLPNLKMKLDFERKAFGAGDEVVAKLELNTNENKALTNYNFRFVANLKGEKLLEKNAVTDESGVAYVRFSLPSKLSSSDGLLNVMIDYQGSTESVSRSIPIVLNKVKLQLFPEGGDLVNGLESKVAFRALNEFDKPADVEGVVMTAKGSVVETFSSYHQGMGAFSFKPQKGEVYTVKITKPEGITEAYTLPEALPRGYVMSVDNGKDNELGLNISTSETEELSVVAQVRGKIYYASAFNAVNGFNKLVIPTDKFPAGVAQVTLFDSKGVERAERLAFVNRDKQLSISIETDKEKYLPREKVRMTVSVKDERGLPMPANLSLAVTNDQLLAFADDKSGNLLSQFLLQQDLNSKVEEPAFYFNKKEAKSEKALDYLLMTSGWRRFTWEKIMSEEMPQVAYQPEMALISGTLLDASTRKPLKDATVKVNNSGQTITTNSEGKFSFRGVDLSSPVYLNLSANGYTNQNQYVYSYGQGYTYYLYNQDYYNRNYGYNNYKGSGTHTRAKFGGAAGAGAGVRVNNAPAAARPVQREEFADVGMDAAMPMVQEAEMERDEIAAVKPVEDRKMVAEKQQMNALKKDEAKKAAIANKGPKDMDLDKKAKEPDVRDDRAAAFGKVASVNGEAFNRPANNNVYYRARQFAAPVYDQAQAVEVRTDFRSTIYWNPNVEVDRTGKKTVEFYNSDDITSFRATAEGISSDGMAGRAEKTYFTQLPFALSTKVPVEVATTDIVSIPLTLKNNTDKPLGGALTIIAPDGLLALNKIDMAQTIMPGKARTIYLDYKVLDKMGEGEFTLSFKACGLSDAFTQKIKMVAKGFPVTASYSAQELDKTYHVEMTNVVDGSLKATLNVYPSVVSDLMKGIEGILREPYGCFEQTSMSSYPNAMILDYLKTTDSKDEKLLASAEGLLDRGYKRLTTFETKEKGYEWFGSNPGHEALTAYGLMQFYDMKKAGGKVDQKMIDRTAQWLMDRRDKKGGFEQNSRALDNFGRANKDIADAYIVYALAEAGFADIKEEFNASYKKAMDTKDPYMLGLMANAAYKMGETQKADNAMKALYSKQAENGSWTGASHSITYSTGQSLTIETTSLAIMGMLKSAGRDVGALTKSVQWLVGSRGGYGAFGNTQGTVLALKALTEYAKFSKKTSEDGSVEFYVDGKKIAERAWKKGDKEAIVLDGLEKQIKPGKHDLKVKYVGVSDPMPYSLAVSWNTTLPASSKECTVDLRTKLSAKSVTVGETVRLTTTVANTKNEGIPSTMAIIGIPAGLTAQPWQLKELQEKKVFDYYEIIGNNIAVYYRCMAPGEKREINLDLKAEIPGEYDAPASSGYLYYTNEYKCWSAADRITVKKPQL